MELLFPIAFAGILLYLGTGKSTVVKSVRNAVDFVRSVYHDAKRLQVERGISPSITLVQAAYESNFNLSQLSRTYKNLFGIKKSSTWTGGTVNLPTKEVGPGGTLYVDKNQFFKTYPTYYDSMLDWADLLERGYPLAFQAAQKGDFDLFFRGLANGKWGAYAGPTDGSFVLNTYTKEAKALIPSITSALTAVV